MDPVCGETGEQEIEAALEFGGAVVGGEGGGLYLAGPASRSESNISRLLP